VPKTLFCNTQAQTGNRLTNVRTSFKKDSYCNSINLPSEKGPERALFLYLYNPEHNAASRQRVSADHDLDLSRLHRPDHFRIPEAKLTSSQIKR